MGASVLTSGCDGGIIIRFIVPSDLDVPEPTINGIQVDFSATGYQSLSYYLNNYQNLINMI